MKYKRRLKSDLLNRIAHADVFEVGTAPRFLFVLIGGSGVDEELYLRRSTTVIPVIEPALESLALLDVNLVLVYVTAPYDVPFGHFAADPSLAATWNAHVLNELLQPWLQLPYFVSGFSGGAALALHGLERDLRCFGGAALGADALPPGFVCPSHWSERLRLYSAQGDRVSNHPANRRITDDLERRGEAEQFELIAGGHQLVDYLTPESLGALIRFAATIAPGT